MKLIDLTWTLSETGSTYPGKTAFKREVRAHYEAGVRIDDMSLSTGIGTHMDAPKHFYPEGLGIDEIPLATFFAPACVLHLAALVQNNGDYALSDLDLEKWEEKYGTIPASCFVLLHTGWDRFWGKERFIGADARGVPHYPGISKEAAAYLAERKISGIGIDTLGIDPGSDTTGAAHSVLLRKNIVIVENLAHLEKLPSKGANVMILPMKIKEAPEAPVRAIAVIE